MVCKRIAVMALAMAVAGGSQAQPVSGETGVAAEWRAVQRSFAEKRYEEAATSAHALTKRVGDPELRLACVLLEAKSLINLNRYTEAQARLEEYLVQKKQSAEALYLLGYVLQRQNKARESLGAYTRAAALAQPQPNDLKLVALDYVLLEDYREAIRWLRQSLAGDPRDAEAWYFLGRAEMQGGAFTEAEKDFRQALKLAPGDAKAYDNLGLALEAQNRSDEAAAAYREAIAHPAKAHEPEQPLLNLGTLLNNENRAGEALPYLKRAAAVSPRSVRCLEELSRALVATGDQANGLLALEQAVALDGSNPRLHFQLGQLYRKAGMAAKSAVEMETSRRLYGKQPSGSIH